MIDEQTKSKLNEIGEKLAVELSGFYGKITFNFQNGKLVNSVIEQSIVNDDLRKYICLRKLLTSSPLTKLTS